MFDEFIQKELQKNDKDDSVDWTIWLNAVIKFLIFKTKN